MKSYTDISQSKRLAEILPLESSDMEYLLEHWIDEKTGRHKEEYYEIPVVKVDDDCPLQQITLPCWSLAALLGVLPSRLFDSTPKRKELYLLPDLDKSYCFYRQFAVKTKGEIYLLTEGVCPVDACVKMIMKLHELKML